MSSRPIVINICAVVLLAANLCLPGTRSIAAEIADMPDRRHLVVLNWSEYLDPAVIAEFETKFNATVSEVYFESDQVRDKLMVQADGKGYDLVLVNGVAMQTYRQQGWLAPLDASAIPNLRHVDRRWVTAFDAAVGFGVPYFWGTLGLAYRSDLVSEPITSWKQLFTPAENLRGRVVMIKYGRDLVGAALMALGQSPNTSDPAHLADAEALLLASTPNVHSYSYVALTEESALVKGDIWATMMYSGDALVLQEFDENIVYVAPEEGAMLWVDYWAVLKSSSNKDLAMSFMNFINDPVIAARLAEYVYYPSPNRAAEKHLSEDFLSDDQIYPNAETLAQSTFYEEIPPHTSRRFAAIMANVVRAKQDDK